MRTVDLWYSLPPVLKNFLEMREILGAEEPEFQELASQCDSALTDSFIKTATDRGLSRYEKMLGIRPNRSAGLETRRSSVMTKWWDVVPYTVRSLKERIATIQGNDNVEISFSEENPYLIRIVTHLETQGQMDDLQYILQSMMPANLQVESVNRVEGTAEGGLYFGAGLSGCGTLELNEETE